MIRKYKIALIADYEVNRVKKSEIIYKILTNLTF